MRGKINMHEYHPADVEKSFYSEKNLFSVSCIQFLDTLMPLFQHDKAVL
jgi:hypothetical protein